MNISSFFTLLLFGFKLIAQSNMASVTVHCTDNENNALQGEQIIFSKLNSTEKIKEVTDKNGTFQIQLKGPGKYLIFVKSLGKNTEAGSLILPMLKAGQSYGNYEVEVRIEPERTFTLDNVFYESGKSNLKAESFVELNELFDLLTHKPRINIEIAGHTDDVEDEQSNLQLSKERAESVKAYLIDKGIDSNRIKTVGYGESRPIADNSNEEGRKLNRRTEVRILN